MNSKYSKYLESEEWQRKRVERLAMSGFRCSACDSKVGIQIHHLTYERVFNERMEDLLPFCKLHHEAAEEMIRSGKLSRNGNTFILAVETMRLILSGDGDKVSNPKCNNATQDDLMSQYWFEQALKMNHRGDFKKLCRKTFRHHPQRMKIMANAFVLYDRIKKAEKIPACAPAQSSS